MSEQEIIDYIRREIDADAETDNFGVFVCSSEIGYEIIDIMNKKIEQRKDLKE